jgi:hypothetical protein
MSNSFGRAIAFFSRVLSPSPRQLAAAAIAVAFLSMNAFAQKPYNPFFGKDDEWAGQHAIPQNQGYQGRQVIRPKGTNTCTVGCAATLSGDPGQSGTPSSTVRTPPPSDGTPAADRLVQQFTKGGYSLQQGAEMLRRNGVGAITGDFGPSQERRSQRHRCTKAASARKRAEDRRGRYSPDC